MTYWSEILKIIEGGIRLNREKVVNYSHLLADKLREDGNERISERILSILAQTPSNSGHLTAVTQADYKLPLDQDSRYPIADIWESKTDEHVVLNIEVQEKIERFIAYYQNSEKLIEAGLTSTHTLLLYGPPGCGKTVLAKYLANKLNLSLVIARLDSLISSYLGNTAKNIRRLFEFAQLRPCILFLDEFDAIAKLRDDNHELGELKRVVNSLLQNIDSFGIGNVLIAATNHQHMLDPAVWRRFNFVVEIGLPDENSREQLVKLFLRNSLSDKRSLKILTRLFDGLSGAQIEAICAQALRDSVLENLNSPTLRHLGAAYFIQIRQKKTNTQSMEAKVEQLRSIDPDFFSFQIIGELLGCTKQWAQTLYRKGRTDNGREKITH